MVYDITSQKSFDSLDNWKGDFITKAGPRDPNKFPFFLFGNKSDKAATDRNVSLEAVDAWRAKNNDIEYEETSAIEGTNVDKAFEHVARHLLRTALA